MSLSLSPSSRMLGSAQRTQIPLAHSAAVLEKPYQIQLTGVSIPMKLWCWVSPVMHINQVVLKTKERELFFFPSALEKTGFLWLFYYLSIIITNELTRILPLDTMFGLLFSLLDCTFLRVVCHSPGGFHLISEGKVDTVLLMLRKDGKKCGRDHS